jgi:tetratricopeptide (TPR) repeat protein
MGYFDLGSYSRKVTTGSAEAQLWFDRGLVWLYGFNHDEAIRSFERALEYDPECAMAWWGIAYARGPHINKPIMSEEESQQAYDAMQQAVNRRAFASPVDRAPNRRNALKGIERAKARH